jgi:hypothetical protein
MKNIEEFIQLAAILVNEISEKIISDQMGLYEAEKKILTFLYKLGHHMTEKVIEKIPEPTNENTIVVNGKKALYRDMQNIHLKTRFGGVIKKQRRSYKFVEGGSYYPLDEKIGLHNCSGFTPLMTYLLSYFGGSDSYEGGAKKLSESLGFKISGTAVQNNTEKIGTIIPHNPIHAIPGEKQEEECNVMIIEIDGTMSPQIKEIEGIKGNESKKQPTEYKECNVITVCKMKDDIQIDRWYGAHYGKRESFNEYVHKTGIKIGQLNAKNIVFIADGAKHNWEIQINNFPDAVPILDFYHACEHLADFCDFLPKDSSKKKYKTWKKMLHDGEVVQVMEEMKIELYAKISNKAEAIKHINYFDNNKTRMDYSLYRNRGYPIGSGMVEGSCKFVVGKRFKKNGMRWKKADNEATLDIRLAVVNETLQNIFEKKVA